MNTYIIPSSILNTPHLRMNKSNAQILWVSEWVRPGMPQEDGVLLGDDLIIA